MNANGIKNNTEKGRAKQKGSNRNKGSWRTIERHKARKEGKEEKREREKGERG